MAKENNENKSTTNNPQGPTTYTRGSNVPTPSSVPSMPKVQPPKKSDK